MHEGKLNNDQFLLKKIADGDEQAFGHLFDLYRPNIYTIALRITGDEWTAEEVLQDTFMKVWINRRKIIYIDNVGGWIYTIAKNVIYNAIKRSQNEKRVMGGFMQQLAITYCDNTDHLTQEHEFQHILNQAIKRLPPKQLLTYQLIKQQEMKREDAALELNVSPETVKWNLDQAMKSIRAFCLAHLEGAGLILFLLFLKKYF